MSPQFWLCACTPCGVDSQGHLNPQRAREFKVVVCQQICARKLWNIKISGVDSNTLTIQKQLLKAHITLWNQLTDSRTLTMACSVKPNSSSPLVKDGKIFTKSAFRRSLSSGSRTLFHTAFGETSNRTTSSSPGSTIRILKPGWPSLSTMLHTYLHLLFNRFMLQ